MSQPIEPKSGRGAAYFWAPRNQVEVRDLKDDEYGVKAMLLVSMSDNWIPVDVEGKGNSRSRKFRLEDGTPVWLVLCFSKGGEVAYCTRPQRAVA